MGHCPFELTDEFNRDLPRQHERVRVHLKSLHNLTNIHLCDMGVMRNIPHLNCY